MKQGHEEVTNVVDFQYRSLIGSLMFIASRTRPDILFSTILMSQYNTCFSADHVRILLGILKYTYDTRCYAIDLSAVQNNSLYTFSDASWATDKDSRKSFGGFIVYFGGIPVSWNCKKQSCVALSSMEAEYLALTDAVKETHWLSSILKTELLNSFEQRPVVYTDSQSAIYFVKNEVENNRSKHIDLKFHFIRDWINKGFFELKNISTKVNVADIFTKWLSSQRLKLLCDAIFRREH